MSSKQHLTVTVDVFLAQKAKEAHLNISQICNAAINAAILCPEQATADAQTLNNFGYQTPEQLREMITSYEDMRTKCYQLEAENQIHKIGADRSQEYDTEIRKLNEELRDVKAAADRLEGEYTLREQGLNAQIAREQESNNALQGKIAELTSEILTQKEAPNSETQKRMAEIGEKHGAELQRMTQQAERYEAFADKVRRDYPDMCAWERERFITWFMQSHHVKQLEPAPTPKKKGWFG